MMKPKQIRCCGVTLITHETEVCIIVNPLRRDNPSQCSMTGGVAGSLVWRMHHSCSQRKGSARTCLYMLHDTHPRNSTSKCWIHAERGLRFSREDDIKSKRAHNKKARFCIVMVLLFILLFFDVVTSYFVSLL